MTARRHHYVSQTYLANFTDDGTKEGNFFVRDVQTGNCFTTSPNNVATQRDFNRVEADGFPPDALENALAPFDERVGQAMRTVALNRMFPENEDYQYIINFLSLTAVRNPSFRESFNRARTQAVTHIGDLMVSEPKIYETTMRNAREAGYVKGEGVPYEQMKSFIQERRYELEWEPESHHRAEFKAHESLLPILARRRWSVVIAPDEGPMFICGDHPVTLVPMGGAAPRHYGYGTRATEVYLPLGSRVGFVGIFEDMLPRMLIAKPIWVAELNRRVVDSAQRHVFSREQSFTAYARGAIRKIDCTPKKAKPKPKAKR